MERRFWCLTPPTRPNRVLNTEVLFAWDWRHLREVALKRILPHPDQRRAELYRARFRHVSRYLRQKRSAHIIQYDAILESPSGVITAVMPMARGYRNDPRLRTLAALQKHKEIQPAWLAMRAAALAGALIRLHSENIVVKDIAADNVLLRPGGEFVMIDLDVANMPGLAPLYGVIKRGHTPPEQRRGAAEPRSDVFALAAMLAQALQGRLPYAEGDLLAAVQGAALPPPDLADVPGGLWRDLLLSCLRQCPSNRPDAQTVHRALCAL